MSVALLLHCMVPEVAACIWTGYGQREGGWTTSSALMDLPLPLRRRIYPRGRLPFFSGPFFLPCSKCLGGWKHVVVLYSTVKARLDMHGVSSGRYLYTGTCPAL